MLAILNYHHVAPPPPGARMPQLYVSPETFSRQLWWLRRLGFTGVTLTEGFRRLTAGGAAGCVALTFDDGYLDNIAHALPILREYGFAATCFVVAGRVGALNTWDETTLGASEPLMGRADIGTWLEAGLEIGSHTCTHPNLSTLGRQRVMDELVESRRVLEHITGRPIAAVCYPYGACHSETLWCAARAGYELGVTVRRGRAHRDDNPLALPRVAVNGRKGLCKFLLKATTPYTDMKRLLGGP